MVVHQCPPQVVQLLLVQELHPLLEIDLPLLEALNKDNFRFTFIP